jgi:uncharacterized protein
VQAGRVTVVTTYPRGAQCWVSVDAPDPAGAREFYGALFGWEVDERGIARSRGRAVAGIGAGARAAWITWIRAGGTRLTDPSGATLAVSEDGAVAELVNEPGSWDLSTLRTPDPERAIAFYADAFGWHAEPFGAITLFRLPGYEGGVPGQPVPRDVTAIMSPGEPAAWEVDFRVADADATAGRARELGATILEPPHDTPGFRTATLADPQGATFSITRFLWPG